MNAVLQIIAKLYPNIFAGKANSLAETGQVIVNKINDDNDYVTSNEAEAFYTELLKAAAPDGWIRGAQESADECMDIIWKQLGLPTIDAALGTPYISLALQSSRDVGEKTMLELLDDYATARPIEPNFRNDIVPIQLVRTENGKTKINTVAKEVLQLAITKAHIPTLSQDIHCQLAGLIVHSGKAATKGHYFTYICQDGQWRLYDDASVKQVTKAQAEQAAERAYLYFYSYKHTP